MTRMAIIASLVSVASIDPALAQPLCCSVWQGTRGDDQSSRIGKPDIRQQS